jgi:cell division protein FtsZ
MLTRRNFFKWLINAGVVIGSGSINPFQSSIACQLKEQNSKKEFHPLKTRVVGLGGAGKNAINHMIQSQLAGIEFIAANTDMKALSYSLAKKRILLGANLTKGLGSPSDPEIGQDATLEARAEIRIALQGSDIVFIVAGLGGGTGTGGAPVIAKISKGLGTPTLAVITKPFSFEGEKRVRQAQTGIEALRKEVDVLITVPNDRIIYNPKMSFPELLKWSDEALFYVVDLARNYFTILDPKDPDYEAIKDFSPQSASEAIKNYFPEREIELIGAGSSIGKNKLLKAMEKAISIPVLQALPDSRTKVLSLIIRGKVDMAEFQHSHQFLDLIGGKSGKEIGLSSWLIEYETREDEVRVMAFA